MSRRIKTDSVQHNTLLYSVIILCNILLLVSVGLLIDSWNRWWTWLIGVIIVLACLNYSICTLIFSKKNFYYELTNTEINIRTEFCKHSIKYENILRLTPKQAFIDKLFNRKEQTIVIHTNLPKNSEIVLYSVSENVLDLINEILSKKSN